VRGIRSTILIALLAGTAVALSAAGVCAAASSGASRSALPVTAKADTAVRWRSGGTTMLLLENYAELVRGPSRMEADRVLIWIDEAASAKLGQVVMEVYAEGHVLTVEQGGRVTSPRVFFRWRASEFRVDDADGFIASPAKPPAGAFIARAEAVRRAGTVPPAKTAVPPRTRPPVAQIPPARTPDAGIVEPTRVGLIYGQQQEGPDIHSFVDGDYRVTVARRYPDVVFFDPGSDLGRMEVLAENVVLWVNDKKLQAGGKLQDAELEIYAEGRVTIYLGGKTIQCEQLFYDYRNQRGLMSGGPGGTAVIKTFQEQRQIPIYYRAKEIRQVSANRFQAADGIITTSEFAHPEWGIYFGRVDLFSGTETVTDRKGEVVEKRVLERAEARHTRLVFGGVPVFYWPYFTRDLRNNRTLLKAVRIDSSSQFGFSVFTEWDLYDLGLYENDWSQLTFLFDYYSKRGEGLGLKASYERQDFFGDFLGYTIHDRGTDKTDLPPDDRQRIRFKWRHRHRLSEHWRADAEFSWLSDSQFLNEYWERESKEEKEQESLLYLRYLKDNRSFSLLGRFRVNDFQTQTEYMPEARFTWLGQPLLGGRVTYIQDSRVGNVRRRWNDELQRVGLLPADYRSWRLVTEHEAQIPLRLGPVRLAPFFNAIYSWYENVVRGESDRVALTAGVRSSMTFWRIYNFYNRLWDINRLRHIVTPTVDVFSTYDLSKPPGEILQFDALDATDDTQVIRLGLRQRLQTRRVARSIEPVAVGGTYTVNWMLLDLEIDYFPRPGQHNNGRKFSPMRMDYRWQISDRMALLSKADVWLERGPELDTFDLGVILDRSPKSSLYLGQRYINASSSSIFIGQLDYKIDERWSLGFFGQIDFGLGETNDYRIHLRRRLHRWIMEMGYEYDAGEGDHRFMLMFWPQGFPEGRFRFF